MLLSEAFVDIKGRMAPLQKDLAKAERATKKAVSSMQATMDKYSASIKKIGKTMSLAGASIIASLTGAVAATVTLGDSFDKMSLRTGMAVEQLSKLSYAAKISGTDNAALETSLRFLARRMEETASGVGVAAEVFDELGISVTDTSGNLRGQMSVLTEAADKISVMTDEAKQVAYAMDIFGARSGPALLPLLKQGSAGIAALTKRAEELGLVLSTESAKAAAEFNDSLTDLRESVKMAAYQIGNVLLPMLKPLVEGLTKTVGQVIAWSRENPGLTRTLAAFAGVVGGLMAVGGPLLMIAPSIISITTAITGAGGLTAALAAAAGALSPAAPILVGLTSLAVALVLVRDRMKEYNRELKAMAVTVMVKAFDDARRAGVGVARATEQVTEKFAELGITAENAAKYGVERFFPLTMEYLEETAKGMTIVAGGFKLIAEGAGEISEETKAALKEIEDAYFELTHTELELLDKLWAAEKARLEDLEVGEKALQKARFVFYKDYHDKVVALERERRSVVVDLLKVVWDYEQLLLEERARQAGATEQEILAIKKKSVDDAIDILRRERDQGIITEKEYDAAIRKIEVEHMRDWNAAALAKLKERGRAREAFFEEDKKFTEEQFKRQKEYDEEALASSLESLAEELKKTEDFEDRMALIQEKHMLEDLQRTAEWADKGAEIRIEAAAKTSKAIAKIYANERKRILGILKGYYKEEKDAREDAAEETENVWTRATDDMTYALSDMFANFITGMTNTKSVWETFCEDLRRVLRNTISDILSDWLSMQIKMAAIEVGVKGTTTVAGAKAAGGLAGAGVFGQAAVGLGFAYGTAKSMQAVGEIAGGFKESVEKGWGKWTWPDIWPFQHGGIVRRPTLALLGEAGPEAVVPLKGRGQVPEALPPGGRNTLVIENVNLSFPNARLEDMDPARFERLFYRQIVPAIRNATETGLLNPALIG